MAEGQSLDFEGEQNQYLLTIKVSDQVNETTAQITIAVTNVIESLFEDPEAFITTWNIPENDFLFFLALNDDYLQEYNFIIDWGDGSDEEVVSDLENLVQHVYENQNTYSIAIKGDFPSFMLINTNAATRNALVDIVQWGTNAW